VSFYISVPAAVFTDMGWFSFQFWYYSHQPAPWQAFLNLFVYICAYSFIRSADAGQVVNVLLAILIGSFSLALLAPELQGNSCYQSAKIYL
jgi:hypothetical protein